MSEIPFENLVVMATVPMRTALSDMRATLKQLASERHPELGPELTLAMRAAEDFRMRLGVVEAMAKGHDPWANVIPDAKD